MLSDEEKQAMKYFYNLRATIDESNMLFDEDIDVKCGKETIKQITTILNLIEKQSKEIEELKENMRKRITYCNELEKDLFENCSNYVVSKDKIKTKIEEYRKLLYSYEKDLEEKIHYVDKESMNCLLGQISILQSLLEEEE